MTIFDPVFGHYVECPECGCAHSPKRDECFDCGFPYEDLTDGPDPDDHDEYPKGYDGTGRW